jgi:hypothetical protein
LEAEFVEARIVYANTVPLPNLFALEFAVVELNAVLSNLY